MISSAAARRTAQGFSLLEVILALGILAGAVAVLGEVARNAIRSAQQARDLTVAELLCEGKMDEIIAGITPAEAVTDEPFDTTDDATLPDWLYSVEVDSINSDEGLSVVRVTVYKDLPPEQRPPQFSLTRWIIESTSDTSGTDTSGEDTSGMDSSGTDTTTQ
jgi:general secretion pathway protein I